MKRSTRRKRTKKANILTSGYDLADIFVKRWNAQPNPPKVYVGGYRIHHGFVGAVMTTLGFVGLIVSGTSKNKDTRDLVANISGIAIGAGIRLMEDDIEDMPDWLNFEKNTSTPQPVLQQNYVLPSQINSTNTQPFWRPNEFV